jgi:hypothetical protein
MSTLALLPTTIGVVAVELKRMAAAVDGGAKLARVVVGSEG